MAFDFSKVKAQSTEIKKAGIPKLIAIVGTRGSGKSGCLATAAKDKKMLLVQCKFENHSFSSVSGVSRALYGEKSVDNIVPYNIDQLDGKEVTGDVVLAQLLDLLSDPKTSEYFPIVAIDSLSALDMHFATCSEVLSADKFSSSKVIGSIYNRLFSAIKTYLSHGGTAIYTLASESYVDGGVRVTAPKLRGSSSVSLALGESACIVLCDKVITGTGDDTETQHIFSFTHDITKSKQKIVRITKGSDGKNVIDSVPQLLSFSPRIAGVATQDLPAVMPADLSLIFDLMDGKKLD